MAERTVAAATPPRIGEPQRTDAELRRLTVVGAHGRRDVVVDRATRIGDLFDRLGLPASTEALSSNGRLLPRTLTLSAAGVADGTVLVAVGPDQVTPAGPHGRQERSAAHAAGCQTGSPTGGLSQPATPAQPAALAQRAAFSQPAALSQPGAPPRTVSDGAGRAGQVSASALAGVALTVLAFLPFASAVLGASVGPAPGAVLLGAALIVAVLRDGATFQVLTAVVAAAGAGMLVLGLTPEAAGRTHLALVAAALGAVGANVLAAERTPLGRRVTATVVLTGTAVAATAVLALTLAWPATVLGVAAVAVAAPLARVVPDVVVTIDATAMLDLDRLSTTAWSPRPGRVRLHWRRLHGTDVLDEVSCAAQHQRLILAGVLGFVALASPALVLAPPGSALSSGALLATAGLSLTLVARRYHERVDRWLLRLAGLLAVASGAVCLGGLVSVGLALGGALVLTLVGVVLVLLAPRVAGGWTSLRWGRLADILEVLAVAATLPLGIWAGDFVPWIRALVV